MRIESNLEAGMRRTAAGGSLAPRRNLSELADEFGVSISKLVSLMKMENSPKCCFETKHPNGNACKWFSQSEMRKWWKEINGGKP